MANKRSKNPFRRTTISVPGDVKKLMDRCPEVNWSAVATQAFREHLGVDLADPLTLLTRRVGALEDAISELTRRQL